MVHWVSCNGSNIIIVSVRRYYCTLAALRWPSRFIIVSPLHCSMQASATLPSHTNLFSGDPSFSLENKVSVWNLNTTRGYTMSSVAGVPSIGVTAAAPAPAQELETPGEPASLSLLIRSLSLLLMSKLRPRQMWQSKGVGGYLSSTVGSTPLLLHPHCLLLPPLSRSGVCGSYRLRSRRKQSTSHSCKRARPIHTAVSPNCCHFALCACPIPLAEPTRCVRCR